MGHVESLDALGWMIESARRVVVFTGAGISTESGIPDYRSAGTGLWNKMKPIEFQDFIASEEVRRESWRRRFSGGRKMESAKPNNGHKAVAKLVEQGKAIGVITQNVDNLFQAAGIDDERIVELHGNATYARCLDCGLRREMADLEQEFQRLGHVGPCGRCGGIIKSATISFGQAMPEEAMRRANALTEQCDLMLTMGSTLVVYPAAAFPEHCKRLGGKLVIMNREPTPLDGIADLVVHGELGAALSYVVGVN